MQYMRVPWFCKRGGSEGIVKRKTVKGADIQENFSTDLEVGPKILFKHKKVDFLAPTPFNSNLLSNFTGS